jgi:hypothetical protein
MIANANPELSPDFSMWITNEYTNLRLLRDWAMVPQPPIGGANELL